MFLAYWPVLGLVVGLVLAAVFTVLLLAGRVCRARHECLPERDISTYLPESEEQPYLPDLDHPDQVPDIQLHPQGAGGNGQGGFGGEDPMSMGGVGVMGGGGEMPHQQYEPGIPYSLDASMSPEGRKEFGV